MQLKLFYAFAILFVLATGCKKDDDGGSTPTPDLTVKMTGTYQGTYQESGSSGSGSFDDVETVVTKQTQSEIRINIKVIPVLAELKFTGTMKDETNFTVSEFTFGDDKLSGSGKLESDNMLNISLDNVSTGGTASFTGTKQ